MNPNWRLLIALLASHTLSEPAAAQRLPSYGSIPLDRIPPDGWTINGWVDPGGWSTYDVTSDSRIPADLRIAINNTSQDTAAKIKGITDHLQSGRLVLYFPPGAYYFYAHLVINRSDLQIAGAGSATQFKLAHSGSPGRIEFAGTTTTNQAIAAGSSNCLRSQGCLAGTTAITSATALGAQSVAVQDASNLTVGDVVEIFQDYKPRYCNVVPDPAQPVGDCSDWWAVESYGQISRVSAKSGNTLALETKLGLPFSTAQRARVRKIIPIRNIVIRDLSIERTRDNNELDGIKLRYCYNCEVARVAFFKASDRNHINVESGYRVSIAENSFDNSWSPSGGGSAYGVSFAFNTTKSRIASNWFRNLRHHVILQAGANHNVIDYNSVEPGYFESSRPYAGDLSLHGNFAHSNLFEGNQFRIYAHDGTHGENGPRNTMFRNQGEEIYITANPTDGNMLVGNDLRPVPPSTDDSTIGAWINLSGNSNDNFVGANRLNGTVSQGALQSGATLPPSLYRPSRPSYFPSTTPWPLYGPDVPNWGAGNNTPARDRSPG